MSPSRPPVHHRMKDFKARLFSSKSAPAQDAPQPPVAARERQPEVGDSQELRLTNPETAFGGRVYYHLTDSNKIEETKAQALTWAVRNGHARERRATMSRQSSRIPVRISALYAVEGVAFDDALHNTQESEPGHATSSESAAQAEQEHHDTVARRRAELSRSRPSAQSSSGSCLSSIPSVSSATRRWVAGIQANASAPDLSTLTPSNSSSTSPRSQQPSLGNTTTPERPLRRVTASDQLRHSWTASPTSADSPARRPTISKPLIHEQSERLAAQKNKRSTAPSGYVVGPLLGHISEEGATAVTQSRIPQYAHSKSSQPQYYDAPVSIGTLRRPRSYGTFSGATPAQRLEQQDAVQRPRLRKHAASEPIVARARVSVFSNASAPAASIAHKSKSSKSSSQPAGRSRTRTEIYSWEAHSIATFNRHRRPSIETVLLENAYAPSVGASSSGASSMGSVRSMGCVRSDFPSFNFARRETAPPAQTTRLPSTRSDITSGKERYHLTETSRGLLPELYARSESSDDSEDARSTSSKSSYHTTAEYPIHRHRDGSFSSSEDFGRITPGYVNGQFTPCYANTVSLRTRFASRVHIEALPQAGPSSKRRVGLDAASSSSVSSEWSHDRNDSLDNPPELSQFDSTRTQRNPCSCGQCHQCVNRRRLKSCRVWERLCVLDSTFQRFQRIARQATSTPDDDFRLRCRLDRQMWSLQQVNELASAMTSPQSDVANMSQEENDTKYNHLMGTIVSLETAMKEIGSALGEEPEHHMDMQRRATIAGSSIVSRRSYHRRETIERIGTITEEPQATAEE